MNNLKFEKEGRVGILTVNRPDKLNALNTETLNELNYFLLHRVKEEDIRVLIFTGAGEKAFIAGADIKEMNEMDHVDMLHFTDLGQRVTKMLESMDIVTIAAVNGYAFGGGLEMALACDFIYASENARVGLPEVTLGLIPGFGGTQRLIRAIGTRNAKELLFTGGSVKAGEAKELGIVNKIFEQAELLEKAKETAGKILSNAFFAVSQAKRAVNSGYDTAMNEALEIEKQMCSVCFATEDRKEGMLAFTEKRKPEYKY